LRLVDQAWGGKKWDVGRASLIGTTTVPVASYRFDARLYEFTLKGSPRCGAVLVPPDAADGSLAGLVDIGDIRWDYPDRDLTNGPYVGRILGDRAREFALVVPCARGMGLRAGPLAARAGGDRRDAWEGAAEDTIGLLTAAVSATRQIDPSRVGAYGYSRGGGVALIVGQRDPRIIRARPMWRSRFSTLWHFAIASAPLERAASSSILARAISSTTPRPPRPLAVSCFSTSLP
jgi:hypothetical protein